MHGNNFVFSCWSVQPNRDSKDEIIARENYWNVVLLTRGKYGLNDN